MTSYRSLINYADAVDLAEKIITAHSGDLGWNSKINTTWDDDGNITEVVIDRKWVGYDEPELRNAAIESVQYDKPLSKESQHYLLRILWEAKAAECRTVGGQKPETHGTIYIIVYILSHMGMKATRNDASSQKTSACDAAAEAMRRIGKKPNSFSGVKDAYYKKRNEYHAAWKPVG